MEWLVMHGKGDSREITFTTVGDTVTAKSVMSVKLFKEPDKTVLA
jgi:hypothetical protein